MNATVNLHLERNPWFPYRGRFNAPIAHAALHTASLIHAGSIFFVDCANHKSKKGASAPLQHRGVWKAFERDWVWLGQKSVLCHLNQPKSDQRVVFRRVEKSEIEIDDFLLMDPVDVWILGL